MFGGGVNVNIAEHMRLFSSTFRLTTAASSISGVNVNLHEPFVIFLMLILLHIRKNGEAIKWNEWVSAAQGDSFILTCWKEMPRWWTFCGGSRGRPDWPVQTHSLSKMPVWGKAARYTSPVSDQARTSTSHPTRLKRETSGVCPSSVRMYTYVSIEYRFLTHCLINSL